MTTSILTGSGRRQGAPDTAGFPTAAAEDLSAVNGYLAAVAAELARRRIVVRALHVGVSEGSAGPVASATVTLDPAPSARPRWVPICLRWQSENGWSATLRLVGGDHRPSARRYLPGSVVPDATAVAHFAAALDFDPDTHWASRIFDLPRQLSRSRLAVALARSARPATPLTAVAHPYERTG